MNHAPRLALFLALSAGLASLLPGHAGAAAPIEVPPGVLAYLPLDESTREVTLHTPGAVQPGVYYPADDADHDTPEATQFERYRVDGKVGGGLRFFAEDRSRAVVEGYRLPTPQSTLALSVFVRPGGERISSLISCRTDSDKQGFALYKWGSELRFQFGDGAAAYVAKSSNVNLAGDQWHHLEVEFDRGTVRFFHNGAAVGETMVEGTAIAPNRLPLTLGTYAAPGRGRERSSFNGVLDEIVIADRRATIHEFLKQVSERGGADWRLSDRTRILDATPQPIEGNEQHFGKPALHSFRGRPVPLTFVFKGEAEQIRSASLIIDVPQGVTVRDAFTGSRNYPDRRVNLESQPVDREGHPYTRYRTAGFDLTDRLTPTYQGTKSPSVTVGLDGPVSTTQVYWSLDVDGEVYGERSFELRILEPLALPPVFGRFGVFSFAASAELTYFDKALQEAVADLYLASNIRGKGRFYSSHPRRWVAFDDYLAGRGFRFFELGLWHGPLKGDLGDEPQPPPAVLADGTEDPRHNCPTRYFASSDLQRRYKEYKQKRLNRTTDTDAVILDYEPWGVVGSICFCNDCIAKFADRHGITGQLTPDRIKQDFGPQWTAFWLDHSAEATRLMHELVKEYNPALHVMEYTYFFDYAEGPEALQQRFWSIAKDPRRHEKYVDSFLLSAYHVNGREYFDLLDQSVRTLEAPVHVIASLSRANALQGRYTPPEESLSPVRIGQKAVVAAAFGAEWFGLYPGNWIDGAYHVALREASDLVWQYETYFDESLRRDDLVRLAPRNAASRDLASLTFARPDGGTLVVLFNFSDNEQVAQLEPLGLRTSTSPRDDRGETHSAAGPWDIPVSAYGVRMIEWAAEATQAAE